LDAILAALVHRQKNERAQIPGSPAGFPGPRQNHRANFCFT